MLVKKNGNTIYVGLEHANERSALEGVRRRLSYSHMTKEKTGKYHFDKVYLSVVQDGMLCFPYGLWKRAHTILCRSKIALKFMDATVSDPWLLSPDMSVLDNLELRVGQRSCLEAIIKARIGVINATTGFGKTFLISALTLLYPTATFHIVTKSLDIASRIYSDLKSSLKKGVGMVGGGKNDGDHRVVVYTADSLKKSPGNSDFLIFDECHLSGAPTYFATIRELYSKSRCYGFSATPYDRGDGAGLCVEALFGQPIFDMPYTEAADNGIVSRVEVEWIECPPCYPKYMNSTCRAYKERGCIWENTDRNEAIAKDVAERCKDTDTVLILVSTVAHAVRLHKLLPDFSLCYSNLDIEDLQKYKRSGLLPEDYTPISKKDRKQLYDDVMSGKVKRVIATSVWRTGVDIPFLDYVYNVSGQSSTISNAQGAGRVSRLFEGKERGVVVDLVDTFSDDYEKSTQDRYKVYAQLGWMQHGYAGPANVRRRNESKRI